MEWLELFSTIAGPAGAAWLSVKSSLNGARKDIAEIKVDVKEMRREQSDHGERLAALEALDQE